MEKKKLSKKALQLVEYTEKIALYYKSVEVSELHLLVSVLSTILNNADEYEELISFFRENLLRVDPSKLEFEHDLYKGYRNCNAMLNDGIPASFIYLFNKSCNATNNIIPKLSDEDLDCEIEYSFHGVESIIALTCFQDDKPVDPNLGLILHTLFYNKNLKTSRIFNSTKLYNIDHDTFLSKLLSLSIKPTSYITRKTLDNSNESKKYLTNVNKLASEETEYVDENVVNKYIESLELEFLKESDADKSCVLVGPSGCGKTTIVHELARRINQGKIYSSLKDYAIYEVCLENFVSGTKYRGEFEEKVTKVLDLISKTDKVILYIDELAHALHAGGAEGAVSFGDMVKSRMSSGNLIIIAATTTEEYNKLLNDDKAFIRRFNKILIDEVNREKTKELLMKKATSTDFYKSKTLSSEIADKIIVTADKYLTDLNNPAKSLSLFKAAFSQSLKYNPDTTEITEEDISAALKTKFNTETFADRAKACFDELNEQVLDQEDAIYKIGETLGMIEHNIIDPQKPLSVLMFFGPSGCGKTESAKIIARKYFGNEDKLIKVDMNNYTTEVDVNKLFGSAPGYTGYDSETFLAKHLREKPNSVVLFDEIEKAHDTVKQALLQMTDEGYFVDNRGNKISLKNCIIIFTTNAGYNSEFGKAHGAGFIKETGQISDVEKAIRREFSPEFLGRINQLIGFKTLSPKIINQLIERNRKFFAEQSGLEVKFNKKDLEGIASEAKIETCGARNIKEVTKRYFYRRYLASSKSTKSKRKETVKNVSRS